MNAQETKYQYSSSDNFSLCYADIPDQIVTRAVETIISQMTKPYFELISEAKEKPEIISNYKSSLSDYYKNMSLNPEIRKDVWVAQEMAVGLQYNNERTFLEKKNFNFLGRKEGIR